jgi:adenine nucleotide transporter 17
MDQAAEAAAAAVAGATSACILFPLSVLKTSVQAVETVADAGGEGSGASEPAGEGSLPPSPPPASSCLTTIARNIYRRDGALGFMRGAQFEMLQSAVEKAGYFYVYAWLRRVWMRSRNMDPRGSQQPGIAIDLILGYLAQAGHLPLTVPLEAIMTRIITAKESIGGMQAARNILASGGWKAMYRGCGAYVILCLKPAIQFAVFNRIKSLALARSRGHATASLSALHAFVIGALARAIATVLVFPAVRAKVLAMRGGDDSVTGADQVPNRKEGEVRRLANCIVRVTKQEGVLALFRGLGPELTRGVLSAAIMLMLKEKIQYSAKVFLRR